MRKKGKENASDAVPTGCTAVLLVRIFKTISFMYNKIELMFNTKIVVDRYCT
jgi:hypothetical protein